MIQHLKAHTHWAVFLLLEACSLVCLFRFNERQRSLAFSAAQTAAGWIAQAQGQIAYYTGLREENRLLTRRNILLQENLRVAREELAHMRHTPRPTERALTQKLEGMNLIEARVCNNTIRQRDNIMLIDKGTLHGIRPEQGVVCGTGIVGIVAQAGERYATVVPILNSNSSISCRLRGTNYFGYLRWPGGNPLTARLEDVPHHARVSLGDAVETSGFSNIFPRGVFVGRVVGIDNSADGQAYSLRVQLSVDLAHVSEVCVITTDSL